MRRKRAGVGPEKETGPLFLRPGPPPPPPPRSSAHPSGAGGAGSGRTSPRGGGERLGDRRWMEKSDFKLTARHRRNFLLSRSVTPIGKQRVPRRPLPGPGSAGSAAAGPGRARNGGSGSCSRGGGAVLSGGSPTGTPAAAAKGQPRWKRKKEITRPRPGSAPLPTTTPFPGLPAPLRAKQGVGGTPAPLPHSVPQSPQPASPRVSSATGVSPPPPRDRAAGEPRNPPAPAQPLPAAVAPPGRLRLRHRLHHRGERLPVPSRGGRTPVRPPRPGVPGSSGPPLKWFCSPALCKRGETRWKSGGGGDASPRESGQGRAAPLFVSP